MCQVKDDPFGCRAYFLLDQEMKQVIRELEAKAAALQAREEAEAAAESKETLPPSRLEP